jgi:ABC-type uncharacterized transport system substrate-binding protein
MDHPFALTRDLPRKCRAWMARWASARAQAASVLTLLALLTPLPAFAHPHLFATARLGVVTDASGAVTGLDVVLVYDEGSTLAEMERIAVSRPGPLDDAALTGALAEDVGYLKEFGYFVEIRHVNRRLAVKPAERVIASKATGLLYLAYHVPLEAPTRVSMDEPLTAAIFDPTYFTEIKTSDDIPPALPKGCAARRAEPPAGAVAAQPAAPLRTIFDFSDAYAENARREAHWFAVTCAP